MQKNKQNLSCNTIYIDLLTLSCSQHTKTAFLYNKLNLPGKAVMLVVMLFNGSFVLFCRNTLYKLIACCAQSDIIVFCISKLCQQVGVC